MEYIDPDRDNDLIKLFREHIDLFIGRDTRDMEYVIDTALDHESGMIDLIRLIDENKRDETKDFLTNLTTDERKLKLFKQALTDGVDVKQDNTLLGDRLLSNGDIDNYELLLSIFPDHFGNFHNIYNYPIESIALIVNIFARRGESLTSSGWCSKNFHSYYPEPAKTRMEKLVQKLIAVGYILNKKEIITLCGGYFNSKTEKWITKLNQTPPQSLAEVCLRQCRRDRVDLSALPMHLNYIKQNE